MQGGDVETFTFASASGCDSLVTVTVNELQSFQTALTLETCSGESIIFNNTELQGGDVETFTFASASGCDSLVTVTVNELQSFQTALTLETCAGESIIFNDTELQGGDVETFTFASASGCDSLVTVTVNEYMLTVNAGNDVQLPLTGTISLVPTLSDNQNELDITWYGVGILAENAHTATQIISEAGTYVLEIQNSNLGCTVIDTVVVAPRDAVTVLLIDDNVLQAPEGYSYQWYFNGELIENADAATYTAQQSGNYWVVITDAAGFSNSSEPMQVNVVGLQNDNEIILQIAPNPSGGVFYINSSQPLLAWELYNVLGGLVLEKQYFNNVAFDANVDICHLPDGMYFLQLYHTSVVSTQHLIVKTGK
ncbi:MAG: T9SS type A sorting domain-containing protein [Sphingobacteriales bacterium]|nr:T9SS type A sorting domain-containing protein [Sphingobacteriales bacterium]